MRTYILYFYVSIKPTHTDASMLQDFKFIETDTFLAHFWLQKKSGLAKMRI